MVQIIAISPDGDTVGHRREDHFKIQSRRDFLLRKEHFFSKFSLVTKLFFRSVRCFAHVSLWSIVIPNNHA